MKRKLLSIFIALVLVLSFSLVTAVPVAAIGSSSPVGDVGPAGGWIFYDLGDGCYLEAAPTDLLGTGGPKWGDIKVPQDVWSEVGDTIVGTSDAIGTGQANTSAIVGQPSTTGIAILADALVVGGYDDWYLPSLDELTLMRDNLATSQENMLKYGFWGGVLGTSPRHYWSSSEIVSIFETAKKASTLQFSYEGTLPAGSSGAMDKDGSVAYGRAVHTVVVTEVWVDGNADPEWYDLTHFATIQDGIDNVAEGGTVIVAEGIYDLTAPIVVDESVTITGDISTPSNVVVNAPTGAIDMDCFQIKADNITIQGFTIQGALDAAGTAAGTQNSGIVIGDWWVGNAIPGLKYIDISNNEITNCSKGISVYRAQHVTISYNKIHDCPTSGDRPGSWPGKGILLYGDGPATQTQNLDVDILHNQIYNNDLMGIELNYSETSEAWVDADVLIDTNIIYNNGGSWADIWDPGWGGGGENWIVYRGISANGKVTGVTINNNEIYDHGSGTGDAFRTDGSSGAIRVASCKGWTITNNKIHDNMRGIHIYDGERHDLPDSNTGHVITGNNIYGNAQGIATFRGGDVGYAHNNNIHGNKVTTWAIDGINPYSAVNLGEGTFDATNNWWGNASGPQPDEAVYESYGAKVSAGVGYNPWLLEAVTKTTPKPPTFEKTLALQDGWTLVSVDKAVAEPIWVGTNPLLAEDLPEETIYALKYAPTSGFPEAIPTDLEPLTSIYVLTDGGGGVGFKYAEDGPAMLTKKLEAGWNLIGIPSTAASTDAILSPLRYVTIGTQQVVGLTTLVSQGDYNQFSGDFYLPTLTEAHWNALLVLDPFDGYWANMEAAETFEVPVP